MVFWWYEMHSGAQGNLHAHCNTTRCTTINHNFWSIYWILTSSVVPSPTALYHMLISFLINVPQLWHYEHPHHTEQVCHYPWVGHYVREGLTLNWLLTAVKCHAVIWSRLGKKRFHSDGWPWIRSNHNFPLWQHQLLSVWKTQIIDYSRSVFTVFFSLCWFPCVLYNWAGLKKVFL